LFRRIRWHHDHAQTSVAGEGDGIPAELGFLADQFREFEIHEMQDCGPKGNAKMLRQ